MPDEKTFRRRRAVFLLLVLAAFVLLTGSFVGAFGGTERGVAGIVSPIQEGASKAAKPFRDLVNWVGDTFRAKGELARVTTERDRLRIANGQLYGALTEAQQKAGIAATGNAAFTLDRYGPVESHIAYQSQSAWYRNVGIDKGTSSGVRDNAPVIGPGGLVGKVIRAQGGSAIVRLITDPDSGVTAKIPTRGSAQALKGPLLADKVGTPGDLILSIPKSDAFRKGDQVYTAGSAPGPLGSRFPPDIPIGVVSRIDDQNSETQVVHVKAHADLRRLDLVTVLTAFQGDTATTTSTAGATTP